MLHQRVRILSSVHTKLSTFLLFLLCLYPLRADENFKCTFCGKVFDNGFSINGSFYCEPDLDKALPNCYNCRTLIKTDYAVVGHRQEPVCLKCRQEMPHCFLCLLPCDPSRGGKALADGRAVCAEHAVSGITDPKKAKQIFSLARAQVEETFQGRIALEASIEDVFLVDLKGLEIAADKSKHSASLSRGEVLGIATIVLARQEERTWLEPSSIHLLNFVPEERMLTVAAHEFAHLWHAEKHLDYRKTSPILREGFAEWVAYKVAQKFEREEQMSLMLSASQGIYYEGLLKILALEEKRGVQGVLDYVTQATTL